MHHIQNEGLPPLFFAVALPDLEGQKRVKSSLHQAATLLPTVLDISEVKVSKFISMVEFKVHLHVLYHLSLSCSPTGLTFCWQATSLSLPLTGHTTG